MPARGDRYEWSFILDEEANILFVDDDPIIREFANVHLSTPTATVEVAADGEDAWRKLQCGRYDIALIDIEMPGLDGYALVERIRADERLAHLPVIMVTGREDIVSIDRAFGAGATSFAVKPVNWRQLSYEIRYALRNTAIAAEARAERDRAEALSSLKSSILRTMRHELKTPLNTILGFSNLIRVRSQTLPPEVETYVGEIESSGRALSRTVNDLLLYAELVASSEPAREDDWDLGELIDGAVAEARAAEAVTTRLEPRLPAQTIEVHCDRQAVTAAIAHLVGNAFRHAPGADVSVRAEISPGGELDIRVTDDGPGIEPGRLEVCLQPFEQGDMGETRCARGIGLGLAIARAAAALHGGRLDVHSDRSFGTLATLSLPKTRVTVLDEHRDAPKRLSA